MREWRRSVSKGLATSATARAALRQRIEQVMGVTIAREMEAIEKRLGFLATVGANATFVGLFGTVWGIMNSFGHIAMSKNTSLAVVAPGISEALFATAVGLVAAIPAAGAYNILSGQVARYAQQLEAFSGEFIHHPVASAGEQV
jgi:biopolymer transport protein TolQ